MRDWRVIFFLTSLFFFTACNEKKEAEKAQIVAQVGDKTLSQSQLAGIMPESFMSTRDSVQFVNLYIKNWITNQLIVNEAQRKLSQNELNIEQELEAYRQEMLIHKYKNKKFSEFSSASISNREIEQYYQKNIRLFELDQAIVQVIYVVFPIDVALTDHFRNQMKSTLESDMVQREEFIFQYAKKYDDFNNSWIYLEYFNEITGADIIVDDKFIRKNEMIEFTRGTERHLVYITNYLLPGAQAPLDFVKQRISSLILNQKKLDFLREFKDSLYNDALKYNKFRVFN
ncbi:MAG: hypothetical protein JXR22_12785 [Prolixibacteraceae bacterium]|nr:hypothetical protein [Prolixibacteraceae bacterium]